MGDQESIVNGKSVMNENGGRGVWLGFAVFGMEEFCSEILKKFFLKAYSGRGLGQYGLDSGCG